MSIVTSDEDDAREAVQKAIDLIDGWRYIKGRSKISIKPNLSQPKSSSSGVTTDLGVIAGLIEKINSLTKCHIDIVESNNAKATADETFRRLGYLALCEEYSNVRCVNLSNDRKVRVQLDGDLFSTLLAPESMIFCDLFISVAKLKTHAEYLYTGVLKNQYGLLVSKLRRPQYHGLMSQAIADLNRFYRPDLSIIDAIVGMEGFGPAEGRPRHVGAVIASADPVAADAVGAQIMGIRPDRIGYLKYAARRGIGTWKNAEVVGSDIASIAGVFDSIPLRYYYFSKIPLALGRFSIGIRNLAEFLRLARSASMTIGLPAIQKRMSIYGLLRLGTDTLFRVQE